MPGMVTPIALNFSSSADTTPVVSVVQPEQVADGDRLCPPQALPLGILRTSTN